MDPIVNNTSDHSFDNCEQTDKRSMASEIAFFDLYHTGPDPDVVQHEQVIRVMNLLQNLHADSFHSSHTCPQS